MGALPLPHPHEVAVGRRLQAQRLIFLSGGVFTAQTRERLAQIGAPQLEKPVTVKELRAWVTRIAEETRISA